jgi:lambda family phage tail tape measure protein
MPGALGELNIDLSANIAKFESALSKAAYLAESSMDKVGAAMQSAEAHAKLLEGTLGALGTSLSALGVVAGAGAFVDMVKGSIETAAEMKHLSEQTGVSVGALSALKGAAKLVGVDLNDAALMATRLDKAMWQAQGGNVQAQSSFEKLGVKATDANGRLRDTEAVLMDVARKFEAMESGAAKTALAQELFGRTGSKMIPLLEQIAEKGNLQGRITDQQAEAAVRLEQSWTKMAKSMNSWKFEAMEVIAPALERLIPVLPAITAGVVGFIAVVKVVPMAIGAITTAIEVMQAATTLAGLTGLGVFAGLTTAVEAFTVALMANPFGALAVAILAAGTALYLFQDHMVTLGDTTASVGNWIGGVWDTIKDGATALWKAIAPIVETVWNSLTTTAMAIFDFYVAIYKGVWGFVNQVFDSIANIARSVYDSMTQWVREVVDEMIGAFQKLYDFVTDLFGKIKTTSNETWSDIKQHASERAAASLETPEMPHRAMPPINDGKGIRKKDAYDTEMQSLGRENAGLLFAIENWDKYQGKVKESKVAIAEFDLAFGKFSDAQRRLEGFSPLTEQQKSAYRQLMQQLENEQRQVDQLNKLKSFNAKTQELDQNRGAELAKRQQELELIGKSAAEAARLKTIYDEQEKAQQRINQALRDGVALTDAQKQSELDRARTYADQLNAVADQKRALERDPVTGAKNFFNNLVDTSTNAAQQVQNALSGAFTSATDALVKFCETGKLNFRSLAESIIQGLLKIAAQQAMSGLVGAIGSAFGMGAGAGGGGFAGLLSGLFGGGKASGGGVNTGGLYLVGESGPELLAMGGNGTVVPNYQLRQAVSSGAVSNGGSTFNGDVNVTVNHNGMTDVSGGSSGSALQNMGAMIGNKVREILITEQRPGGLLAAA